MIWDYWKIFTVTTENRETSSMFFKKYLKYKRTDLSVSSRPINKPNRKQQEGSKPKPCVSTLKKKINKY